MNHSPADVLSTIEIPTADLRAIEDLDALRCAMISAGDMEGFRNLLTNDYIHVHAIGRADTVDDAVNSFQRSPRICRRIDPYIRLYGDIGVITGLQENIFGQGDDIRHMDMQVTTVVRRMDDGWKFVSFHGCTVPH